MDENKQNQINYQLLIPQANENSNESKTNTSTNYETLKCDSIPMCNSCLFEIKPGKFVCLICRVNICEDHLKQHSNNISKNPADLLTGNNHKILKLIQS